MKKNFSNYKTPETSVEWKKKSLKNRFGIISKLKKMFYIKNLR